MAHRGPTRLTRRALLGAGGGALLLAATGCGAATPSPTATAPSAAAPSAPAAPASGQCTAGTKLFKHYYGETCVPEQLRRVIALQDQNVLLPLWELGFRDEIVGSVGALDPNGKPLYRRMQQFDTSRVAFIGRYGAPELEKVVALKPDLIVGEQYGTKEDLYQRLSQIAPTVVIEQFSKPIRESSAQFAKLVGKEAELAKLQGEYDPRVLALRKALGDPSKVAVALMVANEKGLSLEGGGGGVTVLRDVGLAVPKQHAQLMAENKFETYSIERLPDFDGDVILIPTFQQDTYQETLRKFREHPLWQQMNAARKNQISIIDGELLYGNAYQPLLNFLGLLEDHLVKKNIQTGYAAAHPDKVAVAPPNAYTVQVYGAVGSSTPDRGTRLVKHAMGEAQVPANPQRVVVLDTGELDSALALGVKPVGAVTVFQDGDFQAYLKPKAAGIKQVGTIEQPNLEAIAALRPDLILSSKLRHEKIYDKLAQIAPTVFTESVGVTWKANFQLHAEALGKSAEAERLMVAYRGRLEEFQAKIGPRREQTRVSILRSFPDHVRIYMKASFIGTVLQDAGLPRPAAQDQDKFADRVNTKEAIPAMDGDVIFVLHFSPDKGSLLKDWMSDPLWKNLKAVQQGRVYEVPDDTWALGIGILAANAVVDDLFAHLAGASAASPTGSAASRRVRHAMGETTVPASPRRVVVLDTGELDSALALGVAPVGAATTFQDGPFAAYLRPPAEAAAPRKVGTVAQPNLEAIAALRPDLILGSKVRHLAIYDKLAQIAPTVFTETIAVNWKANARLHAEALGKLAEAERLVRAYEQRIVEFRQRMGPRLGTTQVSVVVSLPDDVRTFLKASFIGEVLQEAGLPRPPAQDKDTLAEVFKTKESIPALDGDAIFVMHLSPERGSLLKAWMGDPLWGSLKGVRQGRVYELPDDRWAVGMGILAANAVVDDLFTYLATP